jgi:hypothetical protein
MLVEIRSDVLRTDYVAFGPGLNVVLGDENATNSIGKSTLLMVIDFAFGGQSLVEHNLDVVQELGHHDYYFTFRFDTDVYRYRRGTHEPTIVHRCNEQFEVTHTLGIDEYTAFLKQAYGIESLDLSFRALVGLYLRVWGKDNLSVERPLHVVASQPARDCVDTLIKVFQRYAPIRELTEQLAALESRGRALDAAVRHDIVPAIGRKEYRANQQRIGTLERELDDIRANLATYATDLSEVVNREALQLKTQRDELQVMKVAALSRLQRTQRNLSENRHIRSRQFNDLVKFFPEIDQARLAQVEEFHSGVARLLRVELKDAERTLLHQVGQLDEAIAQVDREMADTLGSVRQPTHLIDHVLRVATTLQDMTEKNQQFEDDAALRLAIKNLRAQLTSEKNKILQIVESSINDGLRRIVTSVFGPDRKSPRLQLREKGYSYEVSEDTGTGTAYASLIVLDLTVFVATQLPVVAHDSVLFKNIENDSVARLLQIYMQVQKQSFIVLDEIDKYGPAAAEVLRQRSVIQLDSAHVLYTKDWRK